MLYAILRESKIYSPTLASLPTTSRTNPPLSFSHYWEKQLEFLSSSTIHTLFPPSLLKKCKASLCEITIIFKCHRTKNPVRIGRAGREPLSWLLMRSNSVNGRCWFSSRGAAATHQTHFFSPYLNAKLPAVRWYYVLKPRKRWHKAIFIFSPPYLNLRFWQSFFHFFRVRRFQKEASFSPRPKPTKNPLFRKRKKTPTLNEFIIV